KPLHTNLFTNSLSSGPSLSPYEVRGKPYSARLEAVADRRDQKVPCFVEAVLGGRDVVEYPLGQKLLDRTVEGLGGEARRDVGAELPGRLAVGDDLRDPFVGAADLLQVGAAERVRGAGDLDDDHLHQLRVVAVGLEDEAGDHCELVAVRAVGLFRLLDRGEEKRPALE